MTDLRHSQRRSVLQQGAAALLMLALTALWAFARDTHLYLVLALGVSLLAASVLRQSRPYRVFLVGVGIGCIGLFIVGDHAANLGRRWQFSLINVIGQRILTDAANTQWFAHHGMPINLGVLQYTGKWASGYADGWAGFGSWLDLRGKRVYMEWLLQSPIERGIEALRYYVWGFPLMLVEWLLACAAALLLARRGKRQLANVIIPLFLLASAPLLWFVIYHGDAMEVDRHSWETVLQVHVALVWIGLLALDGALMRRSLPLVFSASKDGE